MIGLGAVLGVLLGYGAREPRLSSLQDEIASLHGLVLQQDAQMYEEISRLKILLEQRIEETAQLKAAESYLKQNFATVQSS